MNTLIDPSVYFNAVYGTAPRRDEMDAVLTMAAVHGEMPWSMRVYALIELNAYFYARRRVVHGARQKVDVCERGLRLLPIVFYVR